MIPIKDNIPRVHPSWAVWAIIAVNGVVFLYQTTLDNRQLFLFVHSFGMVPARLTFPDMARAMGYPDMPFLSLATHMFLHGGWLHFLLNMWMLWIFADNIEDIMGPFRFLVFYLLCGIAAAGLEYAVAPRSGLPVIGASGAIAGVLGAYFMLYPHAKVLTLVPLVFIPLFFDIPAFLFLLIWIFVQIVSGLASLNGSGESIAWWAHIGGFASGIGLVRVFRVKSRCYYCFENLANKEMNGDLN